MARAGLALLLAALTCCTAGWAVAEALESKTAVIACKLSVTIDGSANIVIQTTNAAAEFEVSKSPICRQITVVSKSVAGYTLTKESQPFSTIDFTGADRGTDGVLYCGGLLRQITCLQIHRQAAIRFYLAEGASVDRSELKDSNESGKKILTIASGQDPQICEVVGGCKSQGSGGLEYVTRIVPIRYADPVRVAIMLETLKSTACGAKENAGQLSCQVYGDKYLAPGTLNETSIIGFTANALPTPTSFVLSLGGIDRENSMIPRTYIGLSGEYRYVDWAEKLIAELDRPPATVELEVLVCEVSRDGLKDLGVEYRSFQPKADGTGGAYAEGWGFEFTEHARDVDEGETGREFEAFSLGDMFRKSGMQINALLSAMKQEGKVKILANPTLSTVDGKLAKYFVGQQVPYTSAVTNSTLGASATTTVVYQNIGIELRFIPRVDTEKGFISIQVLPAISSIGEVKSLGGGAIAPTIQLRQVESTICVGDGETFALAGLMSEEERESIRKIPLLGDLPLVGQLFRSTHTEHRDSEICIFVTPRICPDPEDRAAFSAEDARQVCTDMQEGGR